MNKAFTLETSYAAYIGGLGSVVFISVDIEIFGLDGAVEVNTARVRSVNSI